MSDLYRNWIELTDDHLSYEPSVLTVDRVLSPKGDELLMKLTIEDYDGNDVPCDFYMDKYTAKILLENILDFLVEP